MKITVFRKVIAVFILFSMPIQSFSKENGSQIKSPKVIPAENSKKDKASGPSKEAQKAYPYRLLDNTFDRFGLYVLGAGTLATALAWNNDSRTREEFLERDIGLPSGLLSNAEKFGTGLPTFLIIGGQFVFARKAAWIHLESFLIATVISSTTKKLVSRERPNKSNNDSFPSGHTTAAFATATHIYYWAGWKWGVPALLLATVTGIERLQDSFHWTGDIVAGATIGFLVSRGVYKTRTEGLGEIVPVVSNEQMGVAWRYEF